MSNIERWSESIKELDREATISVFLPHSPLQEGKEYDVIYMCDGQNIFEDEYATYGRAWRLHEKNLSTIVIGISCAEGIERLNEYSPYIGYLPEPFMGHHEVGGKGFVYLEWLLSFKKQMEIKYPIKKKAVIAGSSMGGVFSLFAWLKAKEDFPYAMCFSNAFYVIEKQLRDAILEYGVGMEQCIYLDVGLKEVGIQKDNQIYVLTNRSIVQDLQRLGTRMCYVEDPLGLHNEADWDRRFSNAYVFIEDKKKTS